MYLKIVCIVFVAVCLTQCEAGWRRTISRWKNSVRKRVCPVCPRVCTFSGQREVCQIICAVGCARRKRDAVANVEGHVTPLANQLAAYDLNDDGEIERRELAAAIGESEDNLDFLRAFRIADTDDDGVLQPEEFYKGPFVFEMDLDDDAIKYCKYRLNIDDDVIDKEDADLLDIEDEESTTVST